MVGRLSSQRLKNRHYEMLAGYFFISPWVLGFLIFTLGPLVASLLLSFTEWDLMSRPKFVGLDNYRALWDDPFVWKAIKATSIYSLGRVPLGILAGLAVAILLNQHVKGIGIWRTIYYLPVVLPPVAVSLLWMWIYNPEYGVLNWFLWNCCSIPGPAWLQSETWVLPSLITMGVWGLLGRYMIIYLSGLQSIAPALYEAAELDGAGSVQKFLRITLPLMTPIIFFNLVIGLIDSLKVFTQAYVMTGGGPRFASLFYVFYLYQEGFRRFHMGYASALAWVFFLIVLVLTLIIFRSSRLWVYYESGQD